MTDCVPVSLHWTHGGENVLVVGSFSNWKDFIPMEREEGSKVFSKLIHLPIGIHSYKFVVDGEWKYCPDHEQIRDQSGNSLQNSTPVMKRRKSSKKSSNLLSLPDIKEIRPTINKSSYLVKVPSIGNLATYTTGCQIAGGIKIILVMVGLPARGKSCISKKIYRYLNWLGYKSKIFNLGNYRRELLGAYQSHDFYRGDNPEGVKARTAMAEAAIKDLLSWYQTENGSVAIFDGTNSTRSRRKLIIQRLKEAKKDIVVKPIFIEIICNDESTIRRNVLETKTSSPDYVNVEPDKIVQDFTERIQHYTDTYQTIDKSEHLRYIKILNVGQQIVANRIAGFVPSKILFYLTNLHITSRPIYLIRHGQSEYNLEDRIGGDSPLTKEGQELAKRLKNFITKEFPNAEEELCVWSSTMLRTTQTSKDIPCCQYIRWKTMEEIHAGECDGLTYKEIAETMPDEFEARKKDKLRYRYPRGESYEDVIRRVEPVIVELERQQKPVLVVAHRAILRCLYAYFKDVDREEVPHIDMPLNVLFKLQPKAYLTTEERFDLSK